VVIGKKMEWVVGFPRAFLTSSFPHCKQSSVLFYELIDWWGTIFLFNPIPFGSVSKVAWFFTLEHFVPTCASKEIGMD
jgi:hypothetical protein